MGSSSQAIRAFPLTALPSPEQASIAVEAASSTIHLVDLADGRHTLCGLPLSRVLTGGYCEHLDGNLDDPQFERTIFARDGQEAEPCEECLSRQPSVLVISLEDYP